jgi:branched-chain amino acid transport system substrate-binding protein
LRAITDAGIHYLAQGSGSHVAIPLSEAIARHNARDPAAAIVYLDYAAVDPDLTNGKCNFWHFRFDANTDMRMEALTDFIRGQPQIHKVYLVNQNYSHGQQVARAAKEMLARKRPDIRIVGEDLHPMGQVRDFAPYIAKIRASGAEAVITGNWGTDLSLLVRAARDAGLTVDFYTYYAGSIGAPTAIGAAGADHVHQVTYWHPNIAGYPGEDLYVKFKRRYNEEWFTVTAYTSMAMLATAIRNANSTDPLKVAYALEGLKFAGVTGEVEMRASDHQLQQPLFISVFTRAGGAVKYDAEGTGYGFRAEKMIPAYVASTPTSCQMQRPARP